ncbi:MAG: hypothetical protein ACOY94_05745, partial [Bacillota bacterium]
MIRKALLPALLATGLGLAACTASAPQGQVEPPPPARVSPAPAPPAQLDPPKTEPPKPQLPPWVTPVTDENFAALVQTHRPNEMGRVLILEYHHFGEE